MEKYPHKTGFLHNEFAGRVAATAALFLSACSPVAAKEPHDPYKVPEQPAITQQNDQTAPELPHVVLGTQDANPPKYKEKNPLARITQMADTAVQMRSTAQRIIVNPVNAIRNREKDWATYDLQFQEAAKHGLDVYATLSCRGVNWNRAKIVRATTDLIKREGQYITWLTFCNEPNYHPDKDGYKNFELREMPGLSLPQTAHAILEIGQETANELAPQIKVGIGEILGEPWAEPAKFVEQMVKPVPGTIGDKPLRPDFFSVHPYGLTLDPTEPAPEAAWTINALDRVEAMLGRLHDADLLETPDDEILPLFVSEHAWEVDDPNQPQTESPRYLDDHERRPYLYVSLGYVCLDPNVKMYINYGPLPRPYYKQGNFDTQLIGVDNKRMPSFYVFPKFSLNHPECIIQPAIKNG